MTPEEWTARLERYARVGQDADLTVEEATRKALRGRKVPGHQIGLKGFRIRVSGPMAPRVAEALAKDAAKASSGALRGALG